MKLGVWMLSATAFVLAAACNQAPAPMTDAERTALADSVSQQATRMFASLGQNASADNVLGYFIRGNELVVAENGMIYPSYDSLATAINAFYKPGTKLVVTLDQKHVTVLDRDVVVFTAMLNGVMKDSAGKEMPEHAASMLVYHRTPEGWKIAADHGSSQPPASAPAKPARRAR